jgi:hypothetical protein
MWAVFMNVMFNACHSLGDYRKKPQRHAGNLLAYAVTAFEAESRWSLVQMTKILDRYGIKYSDLISKEPDVISKTRRINIDSDETNVFSYYISKAVCMVSLWEFVEWCIIHNKKILNFNNDEDSILLFCGKLKKMFSEPRVSQLYIEINKKITKRECEYINTMRMTVFDNNKSFYLSSSASASTPEKSLISRE